MITEQGFLTYLYTSEVQNSFGILPNHEFLERIILLYEICDDKDQKKHLQTFFEFPIEKIIMHRKEGENDIENAVQPSEQLDSNGIISNDVTKPDSDTMCFISKNPGILKSKWEFHKTDADYWPSVPHGHLENNQNIKLDAYRGNTFDTSANNKKLKTESKTYISSLWNDEKFRKHAMETLDYFINCNPYFRWHEQRGIIFPRRLPKRK